MKEDAIQNPLKLSEKALVNGNVDDEAPALNHLVKDRLLTLNNYNKSKRIFMFKLFLSGQRVLQSKATSRIRN